MYISVSFLLGPHTVAFPWKYRLTSVGTEMPGASTKLDNPDAEGNGEVE